jgi:hypothetical protein
MDTQTHGHTQRHMDIYTDTCRHKFTRVDIRAFTQTHGHTHRYGHTDTHGHTHTDTHKSAHTATRTSGTTVSCNTILL